MIVVASHADDDHARRVLGALAHAHHPAALVDLATYPGRAALSLEYGHARRSRLVGPDLDLDLDAVGAVWWRRPQPYGLDPALDGSTAQFAYAESHEAISGMWHSLSCAWVNHPASDEIAHHKPLQLTRAAEIGLTIPSTVITNDPAVARSFIERTGSEHTVYKTFIATDTHWRETRRIRVEELELIDRVRLAPVIFQEFIPALADLRVTVVGDELWATEIVPAPSGYDADYRMDMDHAEFRPTVLPTSVDEQVRALLNRLDIVYGAVDLRRTIDGDYVFLEVNPAGEWLFVEDRTGQPIAESVARLLMRLDRKRLN